MQTRLLVPCRTQFMFEACLIVCLFTEMSAECFNVTCYISQKTNSSTPQTIHFSWSSHILSLRVDPVCDVFCMSKQWYGCQCLGFLTCAQILMKHETAHCKRGVHKHCMRESALKLNADSEKLFCFIYYQTIPLNSTLFHSVFYQTAPFHLI